jgi:hypothetical protein
MYTPIYMKYQKRKIIRKHMLPRVGVRVNSLQVDMKEVGGRDGYVLKQDVVELYKFINLPKCTDLYSYTMIIE